MQRMKLLLYAAVGLLALGLGTPRVVSGPTPSAEGTRLQPYKPTPEELREAYQRSEQPPQTGRVYKDRIAPHWLPNNTRFWYRNDLRGDGREFVLVDAERGIRQAAFDHEKLAAALSKAAGADYQADRLPFDNIEFLKEGKAIRFKVGNTTWRCDLASYQCSKTDGIAPDPEPFRGQQTVQRQPEQKRTARSPDGKWTAFVKDANVYVLSADDKEIQLSQDGKAGLAYGMLSWSPDSKTLVGFRIEPGERKEVYLIESSPKEGGRAKLRAHSYALPGDKFTAYELNLFDVTNPKQIKPEVERIDFGAPRLRWKKDSRHFTYQKVDRGHQRFRVIEVDAHTGWAHDIIDEQSKTFILNGYSGRPYLNYLDRTEEIIYCSERDGWYHLYLIEAKEGKVKNQITKGEWVVRGVDQVDEQKRQIWFRASGKNEDQDPYLIHYYRINFDGTGLVALTEGNGSHAIQYSPDRKYLIDTYSRVDLAPVHELRRVSDGKRVCELEEADTSELRASGWEPPEVFAAKGRDGKTDIWGIICRPRKLDPNKKYPVLEFIYAGPHGSHVPKTFRAERRFAALTDLGFLVVQIDGMGTANRSKAFHDVCWHNLKDAGFPDRIRWHQAAAKKYPYYDISRVGIFGGSAGGQNSTAALLFHPDFYKVAVSSCGCHDNRMDKASWNEQWMGYPVGPWYAACSNIDNAYRLRGKLLLIVGELDTNVPPESTLRLVDALIKAGKDFDLLVVPGAGHGSGGAYGDRRQRDYFVRHLLGVEPPDHNVTPKRRSEPAR